MLWIAWTRKSDLAKLALEIGDLTPENLREAQLLQTLSVIRDVLLPGKDAVLSQSLGVKGST